MANGRGSAASPKWCRSTAASARATHPGVTVSSAKGIFNRLAAAKPDVIVAELGDGILGEYGVQDILRDPELSR